MSICRTGRELQPHGCAPCAPSISVRHVRLNEETRPTLRTIIIIRDDSTLTASLVCSNLNRYHCDIDLQIQTNRTVLGQVLTQPLAS